MIISLRLRRFYVTDNFLLSRDDYVNISPERNLRTAFVRRKRTPKPVKKNAFSRNISVRVFSNEKAKIFVGAPRGRT